MRYSDVGRLAWVTGQLYNYERETSPPCVISLDPDACSTGLRLKQIFASWTKTNKKGLSIEWRRGGWNIRFSLSLLIATSRSLQTGGRCLDSNQPLSLPNPLVAFANIQTALHTGRATLFRPPTPSCVLICKAPLAGLFVSAAKGHPTFSVFIRKTHTHTQGTQLSGRLNQRHRRFWSWSLIFAPTIPGGFHHSVNKASWPYLRLRIMELTPLYMGVSIVGVWCFDEV